MEISDFNIQNASKVEKNDGLVKCIYFENPENVKIDGSVIDLDHGCNVLIEFVNGTRLLITISEWGSLLYEKK